jgi:hypothetical protein
MPDPVIYTATLPMWEHTVVFLARLLAGQRLRRRTRAVRRALECWAQAVLVPRWFIDGTRIAQLTVDNRIGRSSADRYLHEAIDVLAAVAPSLHGALPAARVAGHTHVNLDGTLIRTDRSTPRGAHSGSGSVVAGRASPPRRERAGRDRAGRLAAVDLDGPPPTARTTSPAPAHTPACSMPSTTGADPATPCWPIWATRARTPG